MNVTRLFPPLFLRPLLEERADFGCEVKEVVPPCSCAGGSNLWGGWLSPLPPCFPATSSSVGLHVTLLFFCFFELFVELLLDTVAVEEESSLLFSNVDLVGDLKIAPEVSCDCFASIVSFFNFF